MTLDGPRFLDLEQKPKRKAFRDERFIMLGSRTPTKKMWAEPSLVKALLGGSWPKDGFSWDLVDHFRFENGILEPYDGFGEILPASGISVTALPAPFGLEMDE